MKHAGYAKRFAKAYKVGSLEEVAQLWSRMQGVVDQLIIQEWIEGGDSDIYFCLQYRPAGGRPASSFTGRKICQWPLLVGGTASCIPAPEAAAELTKLTDDFFGTVGFLGVGSMEFKRDRRDGRFYMIEPTVGRTDYQEEIAVLNGVNIPLAAYRGELGMEAPPPFAVRPARAWRDALSYANARAAGAADTMREILPNVEIRDAYFRIDDPMPYVSLKLASVRRRLRFGGA
jgi:predicted ATP-grasp superfamily ATP-dependent carboligase